MLKEEALKDFYSLAEYLEREGKLKNLEKYKQDFSAFLNHADHLAGYNFILPFCIGKKVLDVGCFLGHGETILARHAKEIVAIDSDDKALEVAAKRGISGNVEFEKVDARCLPFSNETFDVAVAFHLIEHIPPEEVNGFLCQVKRVLKHGGLLFIITPNRKFRLLPFQRPFNPEHYQEFTAKTFLKTLRTVFDEVEIKGVRGSIWIEQIERKRVRQSPYQVYIRTPIFRFLRAALPAGIKALLKKYKGKIAKLSQPKDELSDNGSEFNSLFQKFSMDVFSLEERMLDKSMSLFAICKKM